MFDPVLFTAENTFTRRDFIFIHTRNMDYYLLLLLEFWLRGPRQRCCGC